MRRNEFGFNLVEVIIAAAILAFGLLAIFQLFPESYSEINYAARKSRAVYLARDLMEKLKTEPLDGKCFIRNDCILDHGEHADTVYIDVDGDPQTEPAPFVRRWVIESELFQNNGQKVVVCHSPPGNPDNLQTLSISRNALPAHVDESIGHVDPLGPCPGDGPVPPMYIEVIVEWRGRSQMQEYRLNTVRTPYKLGT
ncbi:MAG: hypothetical protein D6675_08230 [Gemmatimonadetes bacterium]|nr:MAG: hypothetical protein D6675_08230 [Gemmatimonadota bacterium]